MVYFGLPLLCQPFEVFFQHFLIFGGEFLYLALPLKNLLPDLWRKFAPFACLIGEGLKRIGRVAPIRVVWRGGRIFSIRLHLRLILLILLFVFFPLLLFFGVAL